MTERAVTALSPVGISYRLGTKPVKGMVELTFL